MEVNRTRRTGASRRSQAGTVTPRGRGPLWSDAQLGGLLLRLHGSRDIPQFWNALQALLSVAVPYDALVVYLNFYDFAQSWKAAKILATPNARRTDPWFESRRQVDMTPGYVLSQPRRLKLYRLSDIIPDESHLCSTPFHREYFAAHGWHHVAVSLHWRGQTVCSEIALRRTKVQGDFSRRDLRRLERLYPHLDTVIDRLLALEEERARRRRFESFSHHLPFALMLLDWDLEPLFVNRAAQEVCASWNFGPERARAYRAQSVFAVPAEVASACRQLRDRWVARATLAPESSDLGDSVRAVHPAYTDLTANVSLQFEERCPMALPGFLVQLSQPRATDPARTLGTHRLLLRLSPAERELAAQICGGLSNAEIAARLGKSIATVKKQLTSVYAKTGVDSRSRFLAALRSG